jgi:hypothetical protein
VRALAVSALFIAACTSPQSKERGGQERLADAVIEAQQLLDRVRVAVIRPENRTKVGILLGQLDLVLAAWHRALERYDTKSTERYEKEVVRISSELERYLIEPNRRALSQASY